MKRKTSGCLTGISLLMMLVPAQAVTLAQYVFADNYDNSAATVTGIQSVSGITFASGLSGNPPAEPSDGIGISSNPDNTLFVRSTVVRANTISTAINADDYFSFTVTIADGYALDLTSLSAQHWSSNSYSSKIAVYYTLGGTDFTSEAAAVNLGTHTTNAGSPAAAVFTDNLGSNESLTGEVTFHFLLWDPNNTNLANHVTRLDDVILEGTLTAIPEPGLVSLAFIGLLGVTFRRRR